jgi:hypothetical protein
MLDFREVLSYCDLHDIGFFGLPWTYDNKQAGDWNVRVRLDRAVATPNWTQWFPQVRLQHLVSASSDHCQIFLDLEQEPNQRPQQRIMRYEIMWEREESLPQEIKMAWEHGESVKNLGDVAGRLRGVMTSLKKWSLDKFDAVMKELDKIKQKIEELSMQNHVSNKELDKLRKRMDEFL